MIKRLWKKLWAKRGLTVEELVKEKPSIRSIIESEPTIFAKSELPGFAGYYMDRELDLARSRTAHIRANRHLYGSNRKNKS